jgi:hypothetical protein
MSSVNPVAPGKQGYNVISLRHLFRVVLLKGCGRNTVGDAALVLEAVDGSYHLEQPLSEGREESGHLIFDFYVRERRKRYKCYLKGQDKSKHLNVLPRRMVRPVEKVEEA